MVAEGAAAEAVRYDDQGKTCARYGAVANTWDDEWWVNCDGLCWLSARGPHQSCDCGTVGIGWNLKLCQTGRVSRRTKATHNDCNRELPHTKPSGFILKQYALSSKIPNIGSSLVPG